jgi:hypothetical protein
MEFYAWFETLQSLPFEGFRIFENGGLDAGLTLQQLRFRNPVFLSSF